jgi:hypothetical protein
LSLSVFSDRESLFDSIDKSIARPKNYSVRMSSIIEKMGFDPTTTGQSLFGGKHKVPNILSDKALGNLEHMADSFRIVNQAFGGEAPHSAFRNDLTNTSVYASQARDKGKDAVATPEEQQYAKFENRNKKGYKPPKVQASRKTNHGVGNAVDISWNGENSQFHGDVTPDRAGKWLYEQAASGAEGFKDIKRIIVEKRGTGPGGLHVEFFKPGEKIKPPKLDREVWGKRGLLDMNDSNFEKNLRQKDKAQYDLYKQLFP